MRDLKEIHEAANEKFGNYRGEDQVHQACGLLAFFIRGRALQLVKGVENSNGLDAWRSLNKVPYPKG